MEKLNSVERVTSPLPALKFIKLLNTSVVLVLLVFIEVAQTSTLSKMLVLLFCCFASNSYPIFQQSLFLGKLHLKSYFGRKNVEESPKGSIASSYLHMSLSRHNFRTIRLML